MPLVLPSPAHLSVFLAASVVLLLIPGPAVLYIVGRSISQGRVAGFVSDLGIHSATLVHVAAATLGLSAILAASAVAFGVVKYAGAAYLVWLGLRRLFAAEAEAGGGVPVRASYRRIYRDGFVVNLLNPKTALFFLAFLPQFADPARGSVAAQIAAMGLLFVAIGFVTDGCYALAAGTAGEYLKRNRAWRAFERYVSGFLFIGLGLAAAVGGGRK